MLLEPIKLRAEDLPKPLPKPMWSAAFDAPVNNIVAVDDGVAFMCGDGTIRFLSHELKEHIVQSHSGAILSSAVTSEGKIISGGDDGRVVLTDQSSMTVLHDDSSQWVNSVAAGNKGNMAWSSGRTCFYKSGVGTVAKLECPSTPAALAFDPKGRGVAIALYGGAWLWLPKDKTNQVRKLGWKGSHLAITWSPDGKYVVTATQEAELHGWRLKDEGNLRMAGYPGKVHSMDWNAAGTHLATSGAPAAIIWSFEGAGPMNRAPIEEGFLASGLQRVAWHSVEDIMAFGCAMGGVQLAKLNYGVPKELRKPDGQKISGLAWANSGTWLVVGTANGIAEIHAFGK